MGIFGSIMDKIFHHSSKPAPQAAPASAAPATAPTAPAAPAAAVPASVDVGAVLSEMASLKGGGGNYQTSIVDLLKLLDLDSSLPPARNWARNWASTLAQMGAPSRTSRCTRQ